MINWNAQAAVATNQKQALFGVLTALHSSTLSNRNELGQQQ